MMLPSSLFRDRIISKDILPPQSPNLTFLDYHLWGIMKGTVYKVSPHGPLEPKEAITGFIRKKEFSLLNVIQTGTGAHAASCLMGTGGIKAVWT
jgi:hypothetical protein